MFRNRTNNRAAMLIKREFLTLLFNLIVYDDELSYVGEKSHFAETEMFKALPTFLNMLDKKEAAQEAKLLLEQGIRFINSNADLSKGNNDASNFPYSNKKLKSDIAGRLSTDTGIDPNNMEVEFPSSTEAEAVVAKNFIVFEVIKNLKPAFESNEPPVVFRNFCLTAVDELGLYIQNTNIGQELTPLQVVNLRSRLFFLVFSFQFQKPAYQTIEKISSHVLHSNKQIQSGQLETIFFSFLGNAFSSLEPELRRKVFLDVFNPSVFPLERLVTFSESQIITFNLYFQSAIQTEENAKDSATGSSNSLSAFSRRGKTIFSNLSFPQYRKSPKEMNEYATDDDASMAGSAVDERLSRATGLSFLWDLVRSAPDGTADRAIRIILQSSMKTGSDSESVLNDQKSINTNRKINKQIIPSQKPPMTSSTVSADGIDLEYVVNHAFFIMSSGIESAGNESPNSQTLSRTILRSALVLDKATSKDFVAKFKASNDFEETFSAFPDILEKCNFFLSKERVRFILRLLGISEINENSKKYLWFNLLSFIATMENTTSLYMSLAEENTFISKFYFLTLSYVKITSAADEYEKKKFIDEGSLAEVIKILVEVQSNVDELLASNEFLFKASIYQIVTITEDLFQTANKSKFFGVLLKAIPVKLEVLISTILNTIPLCFTCGIPNQSILLVEVISLLLENKPRGNVVSFCYVWNNTISVRTLSTFAASEPYTSWTLDKSIALKQSLLELFTRVILGAQKENPKRDSVLDITEPVGIVLSGLGHRSMGYSDAPSNFFFIFLLELLKIDVLDRSRLALVCINWTMSQGKLHHGSRGKDLSKGIVGAVKGVLSILSYILSKKPLSFSPALRQQCNAIAVFAFEEGFLGRSSSALFTHEEVIPELQNILMFLTKEFPETRLSLIKSLRKFLVQFNPNDSNWWKHTEFHALKGCTSVQHSGLINQGATCYQNSILQQLFMCKLLRNCLVNTTSKPPSVEQNSDIGVSRRNLFIEFQNILVILSETNSQCINPLDFVHATATLGLTDGHIHQNDAFEFYTRLVDYVEEAIQYHVFQKDVLKDILYVYTLSENRRICKGKHKTQVETGTPYLTLNISKAGSLEELLRNYFKVENLSGLECEKCQANNEPKERRYDVVQSKSFSRLPPVLFIQLQRFAYDFVHMEPTKLYTNISVPETLDISKYLTKEGRSRGSEYSLYSLQGIVVHLGRGANFGHYYSYIRDRKTGKWYKFDDEIVHEVTLEEVLQEQKNNYMLIYERKVEMKSMLSENRRKKSEYFAPVSDSVQSPSLALDERLEEIKLSDGTVGIKSSFSFVFIVRLICTIFVLKRKSHERYIALEAHRAFIEDIHQQNRRAELAAVLTQSFFSLWSEVYTVESIRDETEIWNLCLSVIYFLTEYERAHLFIEKALQLLEDYVAAAASEENSRPVTIGLKLLALCFSGEPSIAEAIILQSRNKEVHTIFFTLCKIFAGSFNHSIFPYLQQILFCQERLKYVDAGKNSSGLGVGLFGSKNPVRENLGWTLTLNLCLLFLQSCSNHSRSSVNLQLAIVSCVLGETPVNAQQNGFYPPNSDLTQYLSNVDVKSMIFSHDTKELEHALIVLVLKKENELKTFAEHPKLLQEALNFVKSDNSLHFTSPQESLQGNLKDIEDFLEDFNEAEDNETVKSLKIETGSTRFGSIVESLSISERKEATKLLRQNNVKWQGYGRLTTLISGFLNEPTQGRGEAEVSSAISTSSLDSNAAYIYEDNQVASVD
eukprot:augustus_masked-scaffold_7-processed-gene-5.1-mRNA-1 protein AED:0.41 eAED:0.45 QI:0/-1/0/1/-1/1/1/0/1750